MKNIVFNTRLTTGLMYAGIAIMFVAAVLLFAGCGNDVKISGRQGGPADVINMPNHFSSVTDKCDGHGHRVYEGDHGNSSQGGGGLAVIADASCSGGK